MRSPDGAVATSPLLQHVLWLIVLLLSMWRFQKLTLVNASPAAGDSKGGSGEAPGPPSCDGAAAAAAAAGKDRVSAADDAV